MNNHNLKVKFLDLAVPDEDRHLLLAAIDRVLKHGRLINGPEVMELERELAIRTHRNHAVAVGSGTVALYLALRALNVGKGDEVITSSMSVAATANAIALTGAVPVFADLRKDLNLDPDSVEKLITRQTKALVPVHWTGRVCQIHEIVDIGKRHNVPVIEDASQAFGAELSGRPAGSFGDLACFSMNSMKVFGACGEAGAIVCNDEKTRELVTTLRHNGLKNREICTDVSLNARMDTIQAAILLQRLAKHEEVIQRRIEIANFYNERLNNCEFLPSEARNRRDIFYTYTIQVDDRDGLMEFMNQKGIETKIHHPVLLPNQPAYQPASGEWEVASHLVQRMLSIPVHEKLTTEAVAYIVKQINAFTKKASQA